MGRATEAKEKTEEAERKETETLTDYESVIDEYAGGGTGGETSITDTENTKPASAMPSGATVIEADPSKGLVIKDSKDNEWVWIEVPKTKVFKSATADDQYDNIEADLIAYAGVYRKGSAKQSCNWTDEWYDYYGTTYDGINEYSEVKYIGSSYDFNEAKTYYETIYTDNAGTAEATSYTRGTTYYAKITEKITDKSVCGLTYDEYQSTYQAMLSSVYTNGGFWIGRYEAGVSDTMPRTEKGEITGLEAKSQKDMYPFNFVTCSQAQTLASAMSTDSSKISSLMFGIQWDLVCRFLDGKDGLTTADINSDSGAWGNYYDVEVPITSANAKQSKDYGETWNAITGVKAADSDIILSTGASSNTCKMNIYDFAGNEWEWTLEKNSDIGSPCASRGGYYFYDGSNCPASFRYYDSTSNGDFISFRPSLY